MRECRNIFIDELLFVRRGHRRDNIVREAICMPFALKEKSLFLYDEKRAER